MKAYGILFAALLVFAGLVGLGKVATRNAAPPPASHTLPPSALISERVAPAVPMPPPAIVVQPQESKLTMKPAAARKAQKARKARTQKRATHRVSRYWQDNFGWML